MAELETYGTVTLASLSYELDEGGGYVSYVDFATFKTALEGSLSATRNVRITTNATNYVDGGIWLSYSKESATTDINLTIPFETC